MVCQLPIKHQLTSFTNYHQLSAAPAVYYLVKTATTIRTRMSDEYGKMLEVHSDYYTTIFMNVSYMIKFIIATIHACI